MSEGLILRALPSYWRFLDRAPAPVFQFPLLPDLRAAGVEASPANLREWLDGPDEALQPR
jgi:hypothetical protein